MFPNSDYKINKKKRSLRQEKLKKVFKYLNRSNYVLSNNCTKRIAPNYTLIDTFA
jgi:hypothetical protein